MSDGHGAHRLKNHTMIDGFKAFLTMSKKHFIVMTRYPVNFVVSFGVVLIFMLMFVLASTMFADPETGDTSGISNTIAYGFIMFMFLTSTLWDIGYTIRDEQMQGTLEAFYLSPVNKFSNMISRIFASFLWTALNSIVALALLSYVIGSISVDNLALGLYVLFISITGFIGVGFVFSAVTLKLKESAAMLANFLQFAFMIICAMFFPFSSLPYFLVNYVSKVVPISYSVDAFRSVMSGTEPELAGLGAELVIVTLFGLLMPVAGYIIYKRIENSSRIDGSLSEY